MIFTESHPALRRLTWHRLLIMHTEEDYWQHRYSKSKKVFSFDWYMTFKDMRPHLDTYLGFMKEKEDSKLLVVGCGNSRLSTDLIDYGGFKNVYSTDICDKVVSDMKITFAKEGVWRPGLKWEVVDVTAMAQYDSGSFEGIIDKGTFDSLICSCTPGEGCVKAREMLVEVSRLLAPGKGVFILVSFQGPEERMHYLKQKTHNWNIKHVTTCTYTCTGLVCGEITISMCQHD